MSNSNLAGVKALLSFSHSVCRLFASLRGARFSGKPIFIPVNCLSRFTDSI